MKPTKPHNADSANILKINMDNGVFYKVELFCTKTAQSEHGVLHFPEQRPTTVLAVKKKVEDQFSIPVCVQKLSFEAHCLSDDTLLEGEKIRSEDTFHIEYSSKGNCKEINSTVVWFRNVREVFIAEDPTLTLSVGLDGLLSQGIDEGVMEKLAFDHFFPWLDAEKYVNRLYFVHCGGLEVVMDIYAAVHRHPWCECASILQILELSVLMVLWNLCETFDLRRLIISHNNGLDLCIKSLLRQKMEEGKGIESDLLAENIRGALGFLCNLSELSECHTEIASNADCLDQLTCISSCPDLSIDVIAGQLVPTTFLSLAYTPSTHPFITKPVLIRRLLDACDKDDDIAIDQQKLMLRYFTLVFLAQVVLISPQCIPNEFQQRIQDLMDDFLKTTTYQAVMEREVANYFVWSTFIPYIKLMYLPVSQSPEITEQLHMLSLQTILLSLQNMLGRDGHRELLFKEGLEEYVTCMPAYVPVPLKEQAKDLVRIVGSGTIQLQPPKLVNLAKAKLAKLHLGLDRVLHKSVREILAN